MGLYVGHSAYAQVLVLAVYLGGMAIGALIVADLSKRVARPLAWYVGAEVALAALGLLFHPAFVLTTGLSYDVVFPALGSRIRSSAVLGGESPGCSFCRRRSFSARRSPSWPRVSYEGTPDNLVKVSPSPIS